MTSKGEKLLEKMRRSKSNWRRIDLERLYIGFGFIVTHGSKHDKVRHPDFPEITTTIPRHDPIAKAYIEIAIRLIDRLLEFKKGGRK